MREICFFIEAFQTQSLIFLFFRGLFHFILHQNEARVGGGMFFHHKSIASLNKVVEKLVRNVYIY